MERFVTALSRVFGVIAAGALVVLMVAIVVDVVARQVGGGSVPSMVEIAESALVVSIFLGLSWALVTGAHVAVTLVMDRLGETLNRVVGIAVWILCSLVTLWLVFATGQRALSSTERGETRMGLVMWPLWPLRWVIVIGFAALALACVVNVVRVSTRRLPMGSTDDPESGVAHAGAE
ncbi:hypothetical protein GCM10010915_05950 [Microbacterium faecale]|uniref:Tripartite ATP-independent periplasmic transporters DctQ component domain-containing protein n=1 Tax=Microbacterium faecale TaxID=1804630 RepID=A0A917DDR3_9MICO|nr:TRAP transporter small permease [Microbacterium faecale]GGD28715.1 hypothetical protein GCM10010915_05950 [Microbacterium faecale]